MTVQFTVPGEPQPAGSKRAFANKHTGRVVVVDDAKGSRPWKTTVSWMAQAAMKGQPTLAGPLRLTIRFYVRRPKGDYGRAGNVKPSAPVRPAKKPDVTKLVRAVEDAMTGIVWRDDAQVVEQYAEKWYADDGKSMAVVTVESVAGGSDGSAAATD